MNPSLSALSDLTVFMKYAKYLPELQRRESWFEVVDRNRQMHLDRNPNPKIRERIHEAYQLVEQKKVLPSMRSMQFAGKPMDLNNSRGYNCAFLPIDNQVAFSEIMFLLLGGTGVGYSVQYRHILQLPEVVKPNPTNSQRFVIGDSIEGWADAVRVLVKSYLDRTCKVKWIFDYRDIRNKGVRLVTSGGKAPGPEPLRRCLEKITAIFDTVPDGSKLSPLQVHDIICHIADAVLAGGIRRAALICLFSPTDTEMASCKTGTWWEHNSQRSRSNNSAILHRGETSYDDYMSLYTILRNSGSGEPGFYWSNDLDWGTNPCVEIGLRSHQFCNLTTMNGSTITSNAEFQECAKAAAFLGTLQATFTDFHYLRRVWRETTEKDALLGVSITGIANDNFLGLDFTSAAQAVLDENEKFAKMLGINLAARTTCVKPEGTSSNVLGTASGIHAFHHDYYVRRMRINKGEALFHYLVNQIPDLIEPEDMYDPSSAVIKFPVKAPAKALFRTESAQTFLDRVMYVADKWVQPGFRNGANSHNVSATISVREEEWDSVGSFLWDRRHDYNGLSILPYDGGNYQQAPFTNSDEEEYNELIRHVNSLNLTKVIEVEDATNLAGELACAGGACEIP